MLSGETRERLGGREETDRQTETESETERQTNRETKMTEIFQIFQRTKIWAKQERVWEKKRQTDRPAASTSQRR